MELPIVQFNELLLCTLKLSVINYFNSSIVQSILSTVQTAWLGYLHIIRLISRRWIFKSTGNKVLDSSPSNHDTYAKKGTYHILLIA